MLTAHPVSGQLSSRERLAHPLVGCAPRLFLKSFLRGLRATETVLSLCCPGMTCDLEVDPHVAF